MYENQTGYFTDARQSQRCIASQSLGRVTPEGGRPNSEKALNGAGFGFMPSLRDHFSAALSHNCIKDSSGNAIEALVRCQEKALLPGEKNPPAGLCFRTETRTAYICTFQHCNKQFTRIYDLHRHHRGIHEGKAKFPCRFAGCSRAVKAFPRKDKRDEHERKIHGRVIA